MSNLNQLVHKAFDHASANGSLIYFESIKKTLSFNNSLKFVINLVPALNLKPKSVDAINSTNHFKKPLNEDPYPQKEEKPHNPFANIEPDLLVSDTIFPNHNLILNKYCVVKNHLLLTTKIYEPQSNHLNRKDFYALVYLMLSFLSQNPLSFYNCGGLSGASQEHKHMQLIPVEEKLPFEDFILKNLKHEEFYSISSIAEMRFNHRICKVDGTSFLRNVTEYSDKLFLLYQRMIKDLELDEGRSYNFILTNNFMFVVPRKSEFIEYETLKISMNSLAFVGLLLAKSEEQTSILVDMLTNIEEYKNIKILSSITFSK